MVDADWDHEITAISSERYWKMVEPLGKSQSDSVGSLAKGCARALSSARHLQSRCYLYSRESRGSIRRHLVS